MLIENRYVPRHKKKRQCQADCVSREVSGRICRRGQRGGRSRANDCERASSWRRYEMPIFLQLYDAKVKQFENGIVIRKCAAFCHLTKTVINRLNRIGCVHNLANRRRIVKKLFDVGKTTFPDSNRGQCKMDCVSKRAQSILHYQNFCQVADFIGSTGSFCRRRLQHFAITFVTRLQSS